MDAGSTQDSAVARGNSSMLAMRLFGLIVLTVLLINCGGDPNRVLFLTTTQIGIDADSKSQNATIGYERYEGYIGPGYENGGVPPVIARLESNLSIVDPKVSQVYATGDAARLASGRAAKWKEKPLTGQREVMFFGTGTNFGIKANFSTEAPGFNLGYKRQEFSLIPIGTETERAKPAIRASDDNANASPAVGRDPDHSEDIYLSVLAAFNLNIANKSFEGTGAGVSQFFATGDAAEELAAREDIRAAFKKEADSALDIRNIDCTEGKDDASEVIMRWLGTNEKNKNTLKSIVLSEFGRDITNWELINCSDFARQRKLVLDKHNIEP